MRILCVKPIYEYGLRVGQGTAIVDETIEEYGYVHCPRDMNASARRCAPRLHILILLERPPYKA